MSCAPRLHVRMSTLHWHLLCRRSVFADFRSLLDSGELADMRVTCHEQGPGIAVHRCALTALRDGTDAPCDRSILSIRSTVLCKQIEASKEAVLCIDVPSVACLKIVRRHARPSSSTYRCRE